MHFALRAGAAGDRRGSVPGRLGESYVGDPQRRWIARDAGPGRTAEQVHDWLVVGRDVVLRGDHGSGRTSVLDSVRCSPTRRTDTVLLRAAGRSPFASLLELDSLPPRRGQMFAETELVDWLVSELQADRSLVLIDDVEDVDEASLGVVARALRRCPAGLVVATTEDLGQSSVPALAALMAERAPAEVAVTPLDCVDMHALIGAVLGGPVDIGLTSTVNEASAGNPRVATLLVQGALRAGALRTVDGRWTLVRPLDVVPVDAVAHMLVSRLGHADTEALKLLSWLGSADVGTAARLVPRATLDRLSAGRRLVGFPDPDGTERFAVSPPALARALRDRLTRDERRGLVEQVERRLDDARVPALGGPHDLGGILLDDSGEHDRAFPRWSAELAGLVHERDKAAEAELRAAWQLNPTVAHANAFLALLARRPAGDQIATVFAATEVADTDSPDQRALFRVTQIRWLVWSGASDEDRRQFIERHRAEFGPFQEPATLREDIARASDAELLGAPAHEDDPIAGWATIARAAALMETGRLALALELCERELPPHTSDELQHYLDGIHGLCLVLLGRLDEAEAWSRRLLETAYDRLDAVGIRVHACVLAEVLICAGRTVAAWRIISTTLRLGPTGPMENTFVRRGLCLAAILRAFAGDIAMAESLIAAIDHAPTAYRSLVRTLPALARAALEEARGGAAGAGDPLWHRGLRYAEEGLWQPALTCWLLRARVYDPHQLAIVRATFDRAPVPLLMPYLRLHEALTAGDAAQIVARYAEIIDIESRFEGVLKRLDTAADPGERPSAQPRLLEDRVEILTAREREVALLARDGRGNREIADTLVLSVRTVENHMSKVLRKLGFTCRAELGQWNTSAAAAPRRPAEPPCY